MENSCQKEINLSFSSLLAWVLIIPEVQTGALTLASTQGFCLEA
jgi:hypothetical protein